MQELNGLFTQFLAIVLSLAPQLESLAKSHIPCPSLIYELLVGVFILMNRCEYNRVSSFLRSQVFLRKPVQGRERAAFLDISPISL